MQSKQGEFSNQSYLDKVYFVIVWGVTGMS